MIKQSKDYISKKKKKYLLFGIMWSMIVAAIFAIGVVKYGERANPFTVVAAVLVLPLAQNLTRFFAYSKYHDPSPVHAELLETLTGAYGLYHGAIVPDAKHNFSFDHIVVTHHNVYFIGADKKKNSVYKTELIKRLDAKGIGYSQIHFIYAETEKGLRAAVNTIQKNVSSQIDQGLEKNMHIIEGMLM